MTQHIATSTIAPITHHDYMLIQQEAQQTLPGETSNEAALRGAVTIAAIGLMLDGLLSADEATDACWYQLHQEKDGSGCLSVSDQDRRSRQAYISITTMEALRQMSLIKRQLDIETSDLTTILQMRPEALSSLIRKACSSAGLQGTYAGDSPKAGMILDLLQFGFSLSQVAYSGGWATQRKAARFICSIAGGRELLAQLLSQNQGDTKPICSPERCTHDDKKNALFMSGVPSPFCCGRGQQRSCQ